MDKRKFVLIVLTVGAALLALSVAGMVYAVLSYIGTDQKTSSTAGLVTGLGVFLALYQVWEFIAGHIPREPE